MASTGMNAIHAEQLTFEMNISTSQLQSVDIFEAKIYPTIIRKNKSRVRITNVLFQNDPQRNMKRKFYDCLTLLTSTEKLLTRAGFELAPSKTPVCCSTI